MSGIVLSEAERNQTRINQAIIQLSQGRMNCKGTVTLAAGATSTVVTRTTAGCQAAVNVGADCAILLIPRTANAAAVAASVYVSSVGQETFTITHPNNANTDKTYDWIAIG